MHACMTHVQIRNVPGVVHAKLVQRAAQTGQSLQQYLLAQLALIANTPTLDGVLDRIERQDKGRLSGQVAVALLGSERARR